ncbi:MAG: SHOCT domain-containing protein [Candidatus Levybacteria bacterium]|nr:SHOCT domain-containing protein [Candidatus Levybacteria bacterium]
MMGGWGAFGIFGWLSMLLFWLLLILGVVALVRYLARSGESGRHEDTKTPLDILKERYAKGKIDKKEFEEKKKDLS